jgi:plastocyanin
MKSHHPLLMRSVRLLSGFVAIIVSTACSTTGVGPQARDQIAATTAVTIKSSEWDFKPAQFEVPLSKPVTLTLDNTAGATEHAIAIAALGVRLTVPAGQILSKDYTFAKAGAYEFVCDLPGHTEVGMRGTLIVQQDE